MRCKICGITNYENAMEAIEAGADALGFVFYEKSPRYIEPKKCREILEKLPPFVEKVGLFVNCEAGFVNKTMRECGLTLAQIHFEADEELFKALEGNFIPVVRAQNEKDLELFANEYRLVDAFVEGYGGEGKRVPLEWFENKDCSKMILAGGLRISNLDEVKKFNFYGVDVSSSVEKEKGIKDPEKVKAFVEKAKKR